MVNKVLFLSLLHGICGVWGFREMSHEFDFVNLNKNWSEAQKYCREYYSDLATWKSMDDVNSVMWPTTYIDPGFAWIGLHDEPASWKGFMTTASNSWRWTAIGTISPTKYQAWLSGYAPDNGKSVDHCVKIVMSMWDDAGCDNKLHFVCFKDSPQGSKQYFLIKTPLSFWDAVAHCRASYTDLAMIESAEENMAAWGDMVGYDQAWIGLYRTPWRWSDDSTSQFTHFSHGQPNNLQLDEFCVAEYFDRQWHDVSCHKEYPFICQKPNSKSKIRMTLRLQTSADLSASTTKGQIFDKLGEMLKKKGFTHVNVKGSIQPQKQIPEETRICQSSKQLPLLE